MQRSCKVAFVPVIGLLTMLHLAFFLILVVAAAHARATSFFLSVHHFFALELETGPKLVQRKPDSWVEDLSKMEVQHRRSASGLDPLATRVRSHRPLVLDRTRAHAHPSVPVGDSWQDPSFEQLHRLVFEFQPNLNNFDGGVPFAALLLALVLNLDRCSVPSIRIKAHVTHRSCSFEG